MPPTRRRLSVLMKPLHAWGPVLLLSLVVIVSAVVISIGLRTTPIAPARPVLISSGSWAPFVGPTLPDGGPITKLVVEVLRRSGYSPEISYTSWPLAEDQVTSGASLGVFPLVSSDSRRAKFLLSDRLIDFDYVLFYNRRNGVPKVSTASELGRLRVGGIAGYGYWDAFDSAVGKLVEFDTTQKGFTALANGQIDLLAEGQRSGEAALTDPSFAADSADFGYLPKDNPLVHSTEGLYFMMAKSTEAAAVLKKFNRMLASMRTSDEYDALVTELTPSAYEEVTLAPVGETGLVELLDSGGKRVLLAPQGTRARVLDWPKEFAGSGPAPSPGPATGSSPRLLVKVKVANGPAQGRVLYVDARALQLGTGGA